MKLPIPLIALTFLAGCGPDARSATVELTETQVRLSLGEQESGCRVLEPEFQASVGGAPISFDARGGGECHQGKISTWFGPTTQRVCACQPAVVTVKNDDLSPFEFSLCGAGPCAKAVWPAAPPMPTLVVEPQADGWLLVRMERSAPVDRRELLFVTLSANGQELTTHSKTQYLEDDAVRVRLSEFDTNVVARASWSTSVDASTCDFAACAQRSVAASMTVRLK